MAYTTINKSTDYFNTKLYTGNGGTQHSITGVGFQPDWTWIKSRDDAYNHFLFDAVRGVGKQIYSNLTNAEATNMNNLYSFNADGFSLAQSSNDDVTNKNNSNFASWNWKANGSGSANTDGSITSTVSANTTAGFSIVKWTGNATTNQTVGHGLGAVPKVIITKNTNNASQPWKCYFSEVGNDKYLILNTTDTPSTSGFLYNTTPTNSLFTISNDTGMNGSGNSIIAYCFAEKTGYSKIGSYVGNGNVNGTFVYTGFKPAFVMLKETSNADNWLIMDNKRLGYNPRNELLFPNLNNAEQAHDRVDLVSNGFKMNNDDGSINTSGATYIYMAFGQSLVGSNNVPCTAR